MTSSPPKNIKLYHIVHIDNLASIIKESRLFSDALVIEKGLQNTTIGMNNIKERRLNLPLTSYPDLKVGECVPFYFCPRSPMLYLFHRNNHEDIHYRGGQEPVVHLVIDMKHAINWANENQQRWAFTKSNAGSSYFEDYCDLCDLDQLDWKAINATYWSGMQDKKAAEFLIEDTADWNLIEEIAVYSSDYHIKVREILTAAKHQPQVTVRRDWYY